MTEKIVTQCSVDGCLKAVRQRQLCNAHYLRWQRYGRLELLYVKAVGNTPSERFWSKVALTADINRCWLWQGSTNNHNGYGTLRVNGQGWLAHIYAWYITYGEKPTLKLLHSCEVAHCVNPHHLREGTQKENIHEMMLRNRYYQGVQITKEMVLKTLHLYQNQQNRAQIAKTVGIGYHAVTRIVQGTHWSLQLLKEA